MTQKRKLKIFTLSLVVSIILIFAFFYVLSLNKRQTHSVSFDGVNSALIDSITASLSDSEKINMLFILKNNSDDYHSIFVSKTKTNKSYKKISDTSLHQAFIISDFFDNFSDFPHVNVLETIADTSTRQDYFNTLAFLDTINGFNWININKFTTDTNTISSVIKSFGNKNMIVSLPLPDFDIKDTASANNFKKQYNTLFNNGINTLFLTRKNDISKLELIDFQGITFANDTIFKDEKDFLLSDVDLILTDSIDSTFVSGLTKLLSRPKFYNLLNQKVKNILTAYYWTQQTHSSKVADTAKISIKINLIKRKLVKNSIVCIKNKSDLLPVKDINQRLNIVFLTKNFKNSDFLKLIKKYNKNIVYKNHNPSEFDNKIFKNLYKKDILIIIADTLINAEYWQEIHKADSTHPTIFINIGTLQSDTTATSILYSPVSDDLTAKYLAQAVYGGIQVSGKLKNHRQIILPKVRLGYDIPEMVNLDAKKLEKIDSIVYDAIRKGAFPGCQVFVAKDGIVVWDKSYGWHTYSKQITVKPYDVYDLASLTKITATTLAAMKMYEKNKLDLDKPIGKYFHDTHIEYDRIEPDTIIKIDTLNIKIDTTWEDFIKDKDTTWLDDTLLRVVDTIYYKATPKNNIFKVTPRQLLMHKSGILPVLPILKLMLIPDGMLKNIKSYYKNQHLQDSLADIRKKMRQEFYSSKYIKDSAEIKVAGGLYLKNTYFDTLWRETKALPVSSKKPYVYSDVNMILLQMTIDTINGYSIDRFVRYNFYKPLGMKYTNFLPLGYYPKNQIIPTENDKYWRQQLLLGYVHDPSAAILGGVAGNAGLFSNAEGLGILGQMLLNGGTYGGRRYLKEKTIREFTATQPDSYRGLGFDKWAKKQIIAPSASPNTYGHTGFTGTCMWIDPDNNIVFVFLSNRVHPSAKNWRINRLKIRQKIHQAVYDAIIIN